MIDDMINGGIFGMIRSGKTTLARKISWFFWRSKQQPSLVLDPKGEWWPENCTVFRDVSEAGMNKFWETVWSKTGYVIVVDEAALTIQRDRQLITAFTMLNKNSHRVIVVGHSGTDLLPEMRQQMTHIFLFQQGRDSADMWARNFTNDPSLVDRAQALPRFSYLLCSRYQPVKTFYLTK